MVDTFAYLLIIKEKSDLVILLKKQNHKYTRDSTPVAKSVLHVSLIFNQVTSVEHFEDE